MPELSRSQLLVYGAIAVAVVLVGVRWVRAADPASGAGSAGVATAETRSAADSSAPFALEPGGDGVVVHVAGAVRDPGVYRLPLGSRVTDAVARAGGTDADAAKDVINLAAQLADGQQITIPARADGPVGASEGTSSAAGAEVQGPISLGSATLEQLDTIEGIGPVTAQDILDFRDERGGVSSVEDLDEISGIGPATMEALRGELQP